ncbi:phage portal protein [Streptomyces prunicolor]|uniref:phage portal protein n=1 Tax=Streptomyces prunicolor TaxID=67348 RepID=UPI0007C4512B|nr:phage portal protein [Streptomyces prunicolor]
MEKTSQGFWGRLFNRGQSERHVRSTPIPSRPIDTATVSAENALGISAVYRAIFILGHTASQLPLSVWKNGTELGSVPSLVSQPNLNVSQSAFVEETVNSLATAGNAYWRIYRDGSKVINLEVLNPQNMYIDVDSETGEYTYRYHGYGTPKQFSRNDIKHLSLMRVAGSPYGLGPIQAAQAELTGMVDVRDYAGNTFRQNAQPTGILKVSGELTPDMTAAYKETWDNTNGGKRGTAVLGNGVDYQPMLLSPADAQFLEVRQYDVTAVARLFGIPASKLLAEVNGNSMTYQNLEQANTDFIRDTLAAYLNEIEEALTSLIPRGQEVRFNLDALLRADKQTRYATYSVGTGGKPFLTVNEARANEGLAPLTGGDVLPNENGST